MTLWERRFIASLRKVPNVRAACKAAAVSPQTAYRNRKDNPAFAAQWQEALDQAVDDLEAKAFELCLKGDSRLIEFMLKSHRPAVYRETSRHELAVGGIIFLPEKKGDAE